MGGVASGVQDRIPGQECLRHIALARNRWPGGRELARTKATGDCCEQRDARQQQPERGSALDLSQAGTGGDRDEIAKRGTGQQKADSRSPASWSRGLRYPEIGRVSCRERGCTYV